MFAHEAGESLAVSQRKTALRAQALREWPFLTLVDVAKVASPEQLVELVGQASGRTECEATPLVSNWLERQHMPAHYRGQYGVALEMVKSVADGALA